MLIGIEATRANKPNRTGVEWYALHVIQELKRLTKGDGNSWILYSNAQLTGGLEVLPDNWYEIRIPWPLPFGWTQMRLSWELHKHHIDVLWLPGSTLPRYSPKQTVVTVHDVGFRRYPQLYKGRQLTVHEGAMHEIKKRGCRVLTVSQFSGREIAELYGIDPQNIAITYNGVDHAAYRPLDDAEGIAERVRRHRLGGPFFMAVGRLEQKKNIVTLIKAFTSFKARRGVGDPYKLALAGIPGFGYDEIKRAIASSPVRDDIVELGYVPEGDKPYLMNAATALVHPALYEGFGIPPVEAMACGCPVISSNAAALPEVLGDAALYANPGEPEDFVAQMQRIVEDPGLAGRMKAAGMVRAAKYTWEATAAATLPVLTRW